MADVTSAQDYAPFGMSMVGRTFSAGSYRFGFNGKENDKETTTQDYGMRIYDPRTGKFFSVDPLTKKYPHYTPYSFAGNKPIAFIDRDGEEEGLEYAMLRVDDAVLKGKMTSEQRRNMQVARGMGGIAGIAVLTDIFIAKGKISTFLLQTQLFSAFEHNRSKTPEGRIEQDKRSHEALTDVTLMYGGGLILGKIFQGLKLAATSMAYFEGNTILKKAISDGVKIVQAASEDDIKYLNSMGAQALYMEGEGSSGTILVSNINSRPQVLEEAIHHQQRLKYGTKYVQNVVNKAKLEIEAQNKLLEIGKKEGWSESEMSEITKAKETWENHLKTLTKDGKKTE